MSIKNKGTGAGGSKTTLHGSGYEKITDICTYLETKYFLKKYLTNAPNYYYYERRYKNRRVVYIPQLKGWGLKNYIREFHPEITQKICFKPDGVFIIYKNNKITIKIVEKKNQNVGGSVNIKLLAYMGFIHVYQNTFPEWDVQYCFSLADHFKKKFEIKDKKGKKKPQTQYHIILQVLLQNHISIFYGSRDDYFGSMLSWGKNSKSMKKCFKYSHVQKIS